MEYCLYDFGEIFTGKKSGKLVPGFTGDPVHPLAPACVADYEYPAWARDVFLWWCGEKPEPLYIGGPTGCGKSSLIRQLASRLLYPVYEVTGHSRLETPELVGHHALKDGATVWVDGPLTSAMRHGGIFLIDEVDLLDPGTATGLNTVLDGAPLCIPDTGETVMPHPGFRFVATANTFGDGDMSGRYQGTLRLNAAFMDRFVVLEATFLPEVAELRLLARRAPSLPEELRKGMVRLAGMVRDQSKLPGDVPRAQALEGMTFSTRTLLRWATWTEACRPQAMRAGESPVAYALTRALGNRCGEGGRRVLDELVQRVFDISK